MLRRPLKRPDPVRFPRAHKRTRQTETPFEFTQKIENGLSAILGFFADFGRVIYWMFRHPLSFDRAADLKGNLLPAVRPFTFIALTAFVATNAVRALTTSILLALLTLERCSAPETQEQVTLPNMASLLKLPAVEDVLLTALPAVLLSVLFLALFLRAFERKAPRRSRALNLCLYVVGLQYLLLALSVALFISLDLFNKKANPDDAMSLLSLINDDPLTIGYVAATCLLILGWPALLASTQITKLLPPSGGRVHARVARAGGVALAALFISSGTVLFALLISIPLSRSDVARQAAPNPTLEVARLYRSTGPEPTVLRLLLTNRSNRTLRLSKGFFEYQDLAAAAGVVNKGTIVRWQSEDGFLLTIKPGDSAWLESRLEAGNASSNCVDAWFWNRNSWDGKAGEAWKLFPPPTSVFWWGFGISSYPTPHSTKGRICVFDVTPSGDTEPVFAFVKSSE